MNVEQVTKILKEQTSRPASPEAHKLFMEVNKIFQDLPIHSKLQFAETVTYLRAFPEEIPVYLLLSMYIGSKRKWKWTWFGGFVVGAISIAACNILISVIEKIFQSV